MKKVNRARRKKDSNDSLLLMIQSLNNREKPFIPRIPIDISIQRNNDEIARISKELKQFKDKNDIEYIKREYYLRLLNESNINLRAIKEKKEKDFNGQI